MSYRNVCYVGWSDECNQWHGFIDRGETHVIEEYTELELEILVSELEYEGKSVENYRELLNKMKQWPEQLH